MLIRLAEIVDEPREWSEEAEVGSEALREIGVESLDGLIWSGTVSKTTSGHLFEAQLSYSQVVACQRCLEAVEQPVDTHLTLVVERQASEPTSGEVELEEDDLDVLYVTDEIIDTDPILMEHLQLNIPMAALCRDDCAGLCPACGANLNADKCDCKGSSVDPRWSVLEGLRRDD